MLSSHGQPLSLVSFGEILWDIIDGEAHLGGAALNLAAHASRLGIHARLVSCVGNDDFGRRALREASRFGVDIRGIASHPVYPTGLVTVQVKEGQPHYQIQGPAAWDFIGASNSSSSYRDAAAVCFGTLAQRSPESRRALQSLLADVSDLPAFYDVNLRQDFFTRDLIEWGFNRASVVKVNDTESDILGRLLFGQAMSCREFAQAVARNYDVEVVLVTLGPDGCLVAMPNEVNHVPGHEITVVDTIGAGDAFSAGFLSSWLQGQSPLEAASIGNTLGAYTASQRGAIPEYTHQLLSQLSGLGANCGMELHNANL
jgi:fructokinase